MRGISSKIDFLLYFQPLILPRIANNQCFIQVFQTQQQDIC